MRAVTTSLLLCLAAGCATYATSKRAPSWTTATPTVPLPQAATLCEDSSGELCRAFVAGVLDVARGKGAHRLAALRASQADDIWGVRAGLVEAAFDGRGSRERRIAELASRLQEATQHRDQLEAEVDRLRRALDELKRLTIEMELRAD